MIGRANPMVIDIEVNTKDAEADIGKFREALHRAIEEDTGKLAALPESMQNLAKTRPWYKEVPRIQWVILALLIADIIVHVVR